MVTDTTVPDNGSGSGSGSGSGFTPSPSPTQRPFTGMTFMQHDNVQ